MMATRCRNDWDAVSVSDRLTSHPRQNTSITCTDNCYTRKQKWPHKEKLCTVGKHVCSEYIVRDIDSVFETGDQNLCLHETQFTLPKKYNKKWGTGSEWGNSEKGGGTAMLRKAVSLEASKGWALKGKWTEILIRVLPLGWLRHGWMPFVFGATCLTGTFLEGSTSLSWVPHPPVPRVDISRWPIFPQIVNSWSRVKKFGCWSLKNVCWTWKKWQLSTCNRKDFSIQTWWILFQETEMG